MTGMGGPVALGRGSEGDRLIRISQMIRTTKCDANVTVIFSVCKSFSLQQRIHLWDRKKSPGARLGE
ncbi:hypothetical protein J6590_043054 [Homalodisca vitripennis]|nr:hypothetical protein J6590_043054 [Homalodisca vitripennis]